MCFFASLMAATLLSFVSPETPRRVKRDSMTFSRSLICSLNISKSLGAHFQNHLRFLIRNSSLLASRRSLITRSHLSDAPVQTKNYQFNDALSEVELRLDIAELDIQSVDDIFVDTDETSLLVRAKSSGSLLTLMQTDRLYEKIKPGETIWYIDEGQLVVNLKKYDMNLRWPDIMETWQALCSGVSQLLKGTSIYLVGDDSEINMKIAIGLAAAIGYTPLNTSELLETYGQQSINSWMISEGSNAIAEAEAAILESLSSHVRIVVATLGGEHGAARRPNKWRHLHSGFTVWLSKSEATVEYSGREEAQRQLRYGSSGDTYANADVAVKLEGWDLDIGFQAVTQTCLSALKQLILSDKQLTGKKNLYIRLGCRGDWPNIKPPGWDPSGELL